MSKNKSQAGNKGAKTPKPQTQAKPEVKETKAVEEVTPEVVETKDLKKPSTPKAEITVGKDQVKITPISIGADRMSPGDKAKLAYVMHERYMAHPDKTIAKYGNEFFIEIDEAMDVMVVSALVDARMEAIADGIPLIAKGTGKQLLALNVACEMFGIRLPKEQLKLAQKNPDEEVTVNVTEAIVHEKTEEAIANDVETRKQSAEKLPNVDPTLVKDEDDLKKTLNYLLTKQGSQMARNILTAIEFMRSYRNHIAESADAKLALEDRSIGEWLEDVLSLAKSSLLSGGLISSVCGCLNKYGNPIMAHVLLSRQLKGLEAVCPLNDEQIASMIRTFIKVYHSKSLPSLDKDGKEIPKGDVTETKMVKALLNGTEEVIDEIVACETADAKGIFFNVRNYYFGITRDNASNFANNDWKKIMRPKFGQILNAYLPLEAKLAYDGNPSDIVEFPLNQEVPAAEEEKKN